MEDGVVWPFELEKGVARGEVSRVSIYRALRWTYEGGDWDEEGVEEGPGDAVEGKSGAEDGVDTDAPV